MSNMEPSDIVCSDCKIRTGDRSKYLYMTTYCNCDDPAVKLRCKECGKEVLAEPCKFCENWVSDTSIHLDVLSGTSVCSAIEVFEHKGSGKQDFKAIADNRHICLASKQLCYTASDPEWIKAKDVRITPAIAAFLKTHHPDWKQMEPGVKKVGKTYHEFGKAYQASYMTPTKSSAGAKECRPCKEEKVFRARVIPACRCKICKPLVVSKPIFRA
jgi:hypothetical protein